MMKRENGSSTLMLSMMLFLSSQVHATVAGSAGLMRTTPSRLLRRDYSGEGTYYGPGQGACEKTRTSSDYIVALNAPDFQMQKYIVRLKFSPACFSCAKACGKKGCVFVQVTDVCPECKPGDLDLSPAAFDLLDDRVKGRIPITWHYVDCKTGAKIDGPVAGDIDGNGIVKGATALVDQVVNTVKPAIGNVNLPSLPGGTTSTPPPPVNGNTGNNGNTPTPAPSTNTPPPANVNTSTPPPANTSNPPTTYTPPPAPSTNGNPNVPFPAPGPFNPAPSHGKPKKHHFVKPINGKTPFDMLREDDCSRSKPKVKASTSGNVPVVSSGNDKYTAQHAMSYSSAPSMQQQTLSTLKYLGAFCAVAYYLL